jgi:PKD repeat protein
MTSNGTTVSAAYSLDGVTFTTVGTPKALDRMTSPLIGISAYNGTAGTQAGFEWFNLSAPTDEFDGTALNDCRWSLLRPVAGELRVTGGQLQIDAIDGDLYNGTSTAKNVVLQPAPASGPWQAITKVKVPSGGSYEQGGLVLFKDDKNFAKAVLMDSEGSGWVVEFGQDINGVASSPTGYRSAALPASVVDSGLWLRMTSDGTSLKAAYSLDGTAWTDLALTRSLATLGGSRIGLAGYHGNGQAISFDRFELKTGVQNTAPVISAATATPGSGTAPVTVQFAATASDPDGTALTYAWDLDGNGTVDSTQQNPTFRYTTAGTYVAKVTVSDGELTTSKTVSVTVTGASTSTPGDISGEVPGTLSVSLGAPAVFAPFTPGVPGDSAASTTATVISTAADATLTVADASATATGHLVNGTFVLPQALQVKTGAAPFAALTAPVLLRSYAGPVAKDVVAVDFKQSIAETDGLRSGKYGKTLVFTLATTTP